MCSSRFSINRSFLRSLLLPLGFLSLFLTCIDRNNPWDPINGCPEPIRQELFTSYKLTIDTMMTGVLRNAVSLDDSMAVLDSMERLNDSVDSWNNVVSLKNDSIRTINQSVENFNKNAGPSEPLQYKTRFDTLDYYYEKEFSESIHEKLGEFSQDSSRIASVVEAGVQECSPRGVFHVGFQDSLYSFLDSLSGVLNAVHESVVNQEHRQHNKNLNLVFPLNREIIAANLDIDHYNDSIRYISSIRRHEIVKTSPQLQKNINDAVAGDTIVIDTGRYHLHLRFQNSGTAENPIVVIGAPFGRTVIDSSDAVLSDLSNIRFYNLVFTRSNVSGFKVESHCRQIYFENCVFSYNNDFGLDIVESGVELRNCQVFRNKGSGLRIQGALEVDYPFKAENILVTHNEGHGMNTVSATVLVSNATISHNGQDGVRFEVPDRSVTLMRSCVTFNGRFGVRRGYADPQEGFFLTPFTNFFGNANGVMWADPKIIKLNEPFIIMDPQYVSAEENDFRINSQELLFEDIGYRY